MLELNSVSLQLTPSIESRLIDGLSFKLSPGQIGCLLGPSGCGKTTTLRLIAGFLKPSQGEIRIERQLVAQVKQGRIAKFTPPERRGIGMLFQNFALFPHLNVRENIAFGLKSLKLDEQKQRINRYLKLTRLERFEHRLPSELSGGQQQRLALARALAPHPKLLLMDEPFSSLDTELRRQLAIDVKDIIQQEGISAILVTHDQQEAMQMADNLGVMSTGRLLQWTSAYQVYHEPCNRFVANFIGRGRFMPGTALVDGAFATPLGTLTCHCQCAWAEGALVDILIRPDDLLLSKTEGVPARVIKKQFLGPYNHYWLELQDATQLEAYFTSHADFELNQWISLQVDAKHLVIFSRDTNDQLTPLVVAN